MTISSARSSKPLDEIAAACNILVEEIEDVYDCTAFQSATMVETATRPGSNVLRIILQIGGVIDLDRFCAALEEVVTANDVFRARIADSSAGIVQIITTRHFTLERFLSENLEQYISKDKAKPMGFGDALFRAALLGRRLILSMHHSIIDNNTTPALIQDTLKVYYGNGLRSRTPFKSFAKFCNEIDEVEARAFWSSRFRGNPVAFPKVVTGCAPNPTNVIHHKISWRPDRPEVPTVHVPSLVEAAWALTTRVYTGADSICLGIVLSGRSAAMHGGDMADTLGPTIVAVPVQVDLRPDMRVGELLKERTAARRQLQSARSLQWGLTKIRTVSDAARAASAFQTMLNLRPFEADIGSAGEIVYENTVEPLAAFSLSLNCDMMKDGLAIEAASDPAVVDTRQLRRVLHQFEHFLHSLAYASLDHEIRQIPLLSSPDYAEIIQWNHSMPQPVEACIHDIFHTQAAKTPEVTAIEAADGSATYAGLDRWSNLVAWKLRESGLRNGDTVAFIFEKSVWTIVSIFAILKAGGICVPIERADPLERKKTIIAVSKARYALASSAELHVASGLVQNAIEVSEAQIEALSKVENGVQKDEVSVAPQDIAYIIFTSGSTGSPKGVMLEHRALATSLHHLAQRLKWNSTCRVLQFAAHVWDISMGEIFGSLLYGGCLCIPSDNERQSRLTEFITERRVNLAWLTPTVTRTIAPDQVPSLHTLLTIGEPVDPEACKVWGSALRFINGWGPCEASILATTGEISAETEQPDSIGIAVNCATWIVSPGNPNALVPIGAVGELLLEGHTIARGYLDDAPKTNASFIDPPSWIQNNRHGLKQKLYRTGDLARYYPDGNICFLGRQDNQVKIRGQRFELGELEHIITGCPDVREAVCKTKINRGRTELVAVLTLSGYDNIQAEVLHDLPNSFRDELTDHLLSIRAYVRSRVPSFMVPSVWLAVQRLPRTPSAKLDRVAIAEWLKRKDLKLAKSELESRTVLTPPVTSTEIRIQSIWSSVIGVAEENIGQESSFVRLGGDSILAMQAASRGARLGCIISVADMLADKSLFDISRSSSIAINSSEHGTKQTSLEKETVATDAQCLMLAVGEAGTRWSYLNDFIIDFTPALDAPRLRRACEQVVQNRPILRTTFVVRGTTIQQDVMEHLPIDTVLDDNEEGIVSQDSERPSSKLGHFLPRFYLANKGDACHRLRLTIHHVLYDAIALHSIFEDIKAAYDGEKLTNRPTFHAWLSFLTTVDKRRAREYWSESLKGSTMSSLVRTDSPSILGTPLDGCERITVNLDGLQRSSVNTLSTSLKAAWALLLSHALGKDDVAFGEVSANRFLPMPSIDQVQGPCINFLPVRAKIQKLSTLSSLGAEIQQAFNASIPYHFLGFRDVIKHCTDWPRWTKFSSMLVFQNHGALNSLTTFDRGRTHASLSAQDRLGDTADVWVIATPASEVLDIELRFASTLMPSAQISWLSRCLSLVLETLVAQPDAEIHSVQQLLTDTLPPYEAPLARPEAPPCSDCTTSLHPSVAAAKAVSTAWEELGLCPHVGTTIDTRRSMFDCGADIVTAFVLSKRYDVSIDDILAHPSRQEQAYLLDSRGLNVRNAAAAAGGIQS